MERKKALFLDRDGVINVNHGYVFERSRVDFIDGIFTLIKRFVLGGYSPVIVTNQSGIAREYYTEAQFVELMAYFQSRFDEQGLPKIPVFFCPHHPDFTRTAKLASEACTCRKPAPGMLFEAARQLYLDLGNSVFIGDKLSDMLAAQRAGIRRAFLFDPEHAEMGALHASTGAGQTHNEQFQHVTQLDLIEVPKSD